MGKVDKQIINILELFGGIRAPYKALLNLFLNINTLDYVENDPKVVNICNQMYETDYKPKNVINYHYQGREKVDLLIGGSPCQDFSTAGLNAGGKENSKTRSSLIWEQLRILKETMPKWYVWENVKNVLSKKHIETFNKHNEFVKSLGYQVYYKVLNAKDFNIPQNRERLFVIGIRNDLNQKFNFDNLQKKPYKALFNFLENDVDLSYYVKVNSYVENHFRKNKPTKEYVGKTKIISHNNQFVNTINSTQKRNINSGLVLEKLSKKLQNDYDDLLIIKWNNDLWNIRYLTTLECFRLMGFNDKEHNKIKVANKTNLYKVAGNSIVVTVLEAIFKELIER